jgi:hypothetical protein
MKVARAFLWFGVVTSLLGGGAYLVAPAWVTAQMHIGHASPAGLTDLRATYAGFQLGMAVLLGWCLREPARYAAGLVAFASVVGALALARALGLLLDGFSGSMATAAALELLLTACALWAHHRLGVESEATAA